MVPKCHTFHGHHMLLSAMVKVVSIMMEVRENEAPAVMWFFSFARVKLSIWVGVIESCIRNSPLSGCWSS